MRNGQNFSGFKSTYTRYAKTKRQRTKRAIMASDFFEDVNRFEQERETRAAEEEQ
jgi:hypothetical protein